MLIGTSGWQYTDWRDVLYPSGLPQRRWLQHYGDVFATVENNNAFYRLPNRETFETWRDSTPPGFVMAVKASRYLTHMKRLNDSAEPVARLMNAAAGLGAKLGPVLLQLPPTLRAEPDRLAACLRRFPRDVRIAVEPRHPSWWTDETRRILEHHGAALCWTDRLGRPQTPLWRTTGWLYLRFHEGPAEPWPHYDDESLHAWVNELTDDAYVYFNNDPGGAAVRNALRFAELTAPTG
ncbi:DUF72 domain-containing protein [Actinomadura chokoriensis]|uniref:DUF72 domain-containing protein n=1 Tax=Actinomadura chokoriensis TaxID=454156 RepID=A0ABV4R6W1_9ACTN